MKKLSYFTYKFLADKLGNVDLGKVVAVRDGSDSDRVYVYEFPGRRDAGPVRVVWWDYFEETGDRRTVSLHVGGLKRVMVTEAVPDAESGADLDESDFPKFFRTETRPVQKGRIRLELGENPLFVEKAEK